jgi:pyruvate/2-oxoglutarate/acetoin dehydrogenase E1 component
MFPRRLFEHGAKIPPEQKRLTGYRGAINEALSEEMERDSSVIVMGQDVGKAPPFGVTIGLLSKFGPERVLDTPISEIVMVGAAVGAAIGGMRPVVEMQFGDFLSCAIDQVVHQGAMLRYLSGGQVKVPMIIRLPCGAGQGTGSHHAQSMYSWFVHSPGLRVVVPSTAADAKGLMKTALRQDNPVLFFEEKILYRSRWEVPSDYYSPDFTIPFGKAEVKRRGKDITVVATLAMVHYAMEAAKRLETEGVSVEVIDPRTLAPLDMETILDSVRKTGRLVVVDEAYLCCGIQGEIIAGVTEKAFSYLKAPPVRLGNPGVPLPFAPTLEEAVIPSIDKIEQAIRKTLAA